MPNVHDKYGKAVVKEALESIGQTNQGQTLVRYGQAKAFIDAATNNVAIEIESRTPKQVRDALLDLIHHAAPKKLLILIPAYGGNLMNLLSMCSYILGCHVALRDFRIVPVTSNGYDPRLEEDVRLVMEALKELTTS
ncbi:MAG: hypothetical protein Q7K03_09915 [Dehalococcoidia bacterium]|nr:hypothetical protein [Dehalococcoidia bacterium]